MRSLAMCFEDQITRLLEKMTTAEKIGQLVQFGSFRELEEGLVDAGEIGSLLNFCGSTQVTEIQTRIMRSKCPVPLLIGDDVIHGYKTGFPIPLAESCSFDLECMEETAAIAAREAACDGVNMIFAPMVDVARDPRWGRVAEGAGEDPWYGAQVAAARVRGFQRNDWEDKPHVTACPKHYVGYAASEGGRDYSYTEISGRTLREVYLPPFEAAIKAGAGAVMSAFNDVSGDPASLSHHLLEEILRDELGFRGLVVSDWESVEQGVAHGVAENTREAVKKGLTAGVEIDMNSGIYREELPKLVADGEITAEQLDRAVRRVLRVKFALGLFAQYESPESRKAAVHRCPEHVRTARKMARESIVLLENRDGLLPLSRQAKKIAVIGPLADAPGQMLGCWQCKTDKDNVVTLLQGIREACPDAEIRYEKGCPLPFEEDQSGEIDPAVELARQSGIVLLALGEPCGFCGENASRARLDLPDPQMELLRRVCEANPRTVLILMNGRPLALTRVREVAGTILEAWYLGDECGHALADVLFGDYNPSGKLTMTFPRSVGQIPLYYNHRNSGRPELIRYIDEEITPLYPFGYGLSYSKFVYQGLTLSRTALRPGETLTAAVTLRNESGRGGEEVVQLYLRDPVASVTRPVRELKGFQKIFLASGEEKTVEFTIGEEMLAFPGADGKPAAEPGEFQVFAGTDSSCTLCASFRLEQQS